MPPVPLQTVWRTRLAAAAGLLLGAAFGIYRQSPHFFSPYVCNDDARQQLYWMASFHDSALFQNDIVVDYAKQYVTPLVKAIYWILTLVWEPIIAGKLVAVMLMGLGTYWCYRIGEKLCGIPGGLAAAILFTTSVPVADRIVGGNPRAFMFALLAAWLCYLLRQEHRKVAITAVVSALTYPMAFVLCGPVWLADAVRFENRRPTIDRSRRRWIVTIIGLGLGGVGLGTKYLTVDPRFGPIAGRNRVMKDPAFRDGGRFAEVLGDGRVSTWDDVVKSAGAPLGLRGRWDGKSWERSNPSWPPKVLAGFIVAWLLLAAFKIVPLPRQFVYLALSSVIMYVLAWAVVFRLFVPTRYVQFSLALLVLLGMAVLLAAPAARVRAGRLRTIRSVVTVVLASGLAFGLTMPRNPVPHIPRNVANLPALTAFWKRIEQVVPPDAVVAGLPEYLDGLGAFAKRKAYMPDELAHPAYTTYYDSVVIPRIRKTFDVLLAQRPEEVLRFAADEGVDYLLFNTVKLARGDVSYHKPFDAQLKRLIHNNRPRCLLQFNDPRRILVGLGQANQTRLIRISPGPDNVFGVRE